MKSLWIIKHEWNRNINLESEYKFPKYCQTRWLVTIISLNELITIVKSVSVFMYTKLQFGNARFVLNYYHIYYVSTVEMPNKIEVQCGTFETVLQPRSTDQFNQNFWSASHSLSVIMDWTSAGSEPTAWCWSAHLELFFSFMLEKVEDSGWNLVHYLVSRWLWSENTADHWLVPILYLFPASNLPLSVPRELAVASAVSICISANMKILISGYVLMSGSGS